MVAGYGRLFAQAALIVCLQGGNVLAIARGQVALAVGISFALNAIWWSNSRAAAWSPLPGARWVYAAGAATGALVALLAG